MGQKRYPSLTPDEVISILRKLGFARKRQGGSHQQWECPQTGNFRRSIVTVDVGYREFSEERIKNMIRQSNRTREEFYGATRRTAQKAGVQFVRTSTSTEID